MTDRAPDHSWPSCAKRMRKHQHALALAAPRGRDNVHKRYLIHVASHNIGLLMRHLIGAGTPKEVAARGRAPLVVVYRDAPIYFQRKMC